MTPAGPPVPAWLRQLAADASAMELPPMLVPPAGTGRPSAVLVLFAEGPGGPGDPDLLFIQRSDGLRLHAGQPAFPGGAIDAADSGPVAAALREAAEEVGVDPAGVEVVGTLPELFIPPTGFRVVPVLAWWRRPVAVAPVDTGEVAAVERVSVRELADPAVRTDGARARRAHHPRVPGQGDGHLGLHGDARRSPAPAGRVGAALGRRRGRRPLTPCAGRYTFEVVHGDVLDLILLVVIAAFATSGYRQGFIVGVLSFFGFVGGALLGAEFGPSISRALVGGQTQQDVIAMVLLVAFAVIGQFVASSIGAAMRSTVTWRSATVLDSVGGALVSVVSFLLIAWVVGSVLNGSPFPLVDGQVNNSLVLQTVDRFVPSPARTMFSDFRRLLATNSTYSEVFSKIGAERIFDVPAPDPSVLDSRGYLAARASVVRVQGVAPSCSLSIEGSGFVISPDHILTNAHVVAGVTEHQTVTTASGQVL